MVSFTRTLQKHITKTGTHYVLSIPREIARDLQLEAGGLCNLEVRTEPKGKAYVALTSYQEGPLYIRQFNIERLDDYDEPLMNAIPLENPVTKGRSQAVDRQQFKSFLVTSNLMLKYIKLRLNLMRSTKSGRAALAMQTAQIELLPTPWAKGTGKSQLGMVGLSALSALTFALSPYRHRATTQILHKIFLKEPGPSPKLHKNYTSKLPSNFACG